MLSTAPIRAYIPALDVRRARNFYEQIIGLTPREERECDRLHRR